MKKKSCLSVPFLSIQRDHTVISSVVDLKCHIFSISISRSSSLFILLYSLADTPVSSGISFRRHVFLL